MKPIPNAFALSTSCLGLHPSHSLDQKLRATAKHGFTGIEIVYGDLERYSVARNTSMIEGAKLVRQQCYDLNLTILSLCPFENFEGTKSPISKRLEEAKRWLEIARVLGALHLQIPAQYGKNVDTSESIIVSELQQLADLASSSKPVVGIAYEPMGWSTCYSTWEDALRLNDKVNRSNFGLCLDSFHILSKLWGDPFSVSGIYSDGPQKLAASLRRMAKELPLEKIKYIQLSDGEKFEPPFSDSHKWYLEGEDAQFTWSKWARPFPLETDLGGYMPVTDFVRTVLKELGGDGWKGWVSMETFDRRMRNEGFKVDDGAKRARVSVKKLEDALKKRERANL
jgi:sugar phosphate isomerase/epimerase